LIPKKIKNKKESFKMLKFGVQKGNEIYLNDFVSVDVILEEYNDFILETLDNDINTNNLDYDTQELQRFIIDNRLEKYLDLSYIDNISMLFSSIRDDDVRFMLFEYLKDTTSVMYDTTFYDYISQHTNYNVVYVDTADDYNEYMYLVDNMENIIFDFEF
jgi:hypothetical protein